MACQEENDDGALWCSAGAWQIYKLFHRGEDSLAMWGSAAQSARNPKRSAIQITTNFPHTPGDVKFECANGKVLRMRHFETNHTTSPRPIGYYVWWAAKKLDECLQRPVAMHVRGKVWRLDTKLLREALANARDRAGYEPPPASTIQAPEQSAAAATKADGERLLSQAMGGNAAAQYAMGLRYYKGVGVETNVVEAYAWLNLAAAQGHSKAREKRNEMKAMLERVTIEKAQRRTGELAAEM